ncbi:DNA cytosine methyltransferase [Nostoc punctiforme UO1]|uniref:DNA cytosine methyltransferase n=1 Tax=Nostoc punctiforme TaxID=272131 RepID=UPI00309C521C
MPCVCTSNSGNRLGLADFRSAPGENNLGSLTSVDPAIALIENPTGLLSRGMATVLKDLSKIRYVCEWETIPAYCLGLPRERERVFIVAYADGLFYRQQPTPWADQIGNQITQVRFSHEDRSFKPGIREVASGVPVGVAKGIKGNYDARRAYGLSCSPRQAAIAWKRIDYLCGLKSSQEA